MATKWGIASAGKISHDFVTAVRSLESNDHKFVAVAARNLESAKKFADLHKIPKAYGSYEELANDPEVEVVYIGTINIAHHPVAKMFLNAGKPLLIEKPMTVNSKQTQELVDLARSKKVFMMEALWTRFIPAYVFIREQLEKGAIGDVVHVQATFGQDGGKLDLKRDKADGSLLDMGCYVLNAVLTAVKDAKPETIKAIGTLNQDGCDTFTSALLRFPGDKTASIIATWRCQFPNEAHIMGTNGSIRVYRPFHCTETVEVNGKRYEFPMKPTILPCNYVNSSALHHEADEVRRCLREGLLESPTMPLDTSILIANIEDEIRKQIGVVYPVD